MVVRALLNLRVTTEVLLMRFSKSFALASALMLCAPMVATAAPAQHAEVVVSQKAQAAPSRDVGTRYAEREARDTKVGEFEGGSVVVVISGGALLVALLVVLLVL